MSSITIPVDPETARAFEQASEEDRRKLQLLLSLRLRELTTSPPKSLESVINEIREKARAQGLTPELLDSLLNAE